jgi:NAD(P)-dependent dehydrogenase (short-subunit alcohol dehydrogenase family)
LKTGARSDRTQAAQARVIGEIFIYPGIVATSVGSDRRVAIVTGASCGIGKSLALSFAAQGFAVAICARSKPALEETAKGIGKEGGDCVAIQTDITKRKEVNGMVKKVVDSYGRVDVLVNNAGVGSFQPLDEITEEEFDRILDTNLKGAFFAIQAVLPYMREQGSGQIVNVSSVLGYQGCCDASAYCASKWGLRGLTEALRCELKPFGIKIGLVAPGLTETEYFDDWDIKPALHSALQPEDVSSAVMTIACQSEKSDIKEILVENIGKGHRHW